LVLLHAFHSLSVLFFHFQYSSIFFHSNPYYPFLRFLFIVRSHLVTFPFNLHFPRHFHSVFLSPSYFMGYFFRMFTDRSCLLYTYSNRSDITLFLFITFLLTRLLVYRLNSVRSLPFLRFYFFSVYENFSLVFHFSIFLIPV